LAKMSLAKLSYKILHLYKFCLQFL